MAKTKTLIDWFRNGTEDELIRLLNKYFKNDFENLWCDNKGRCPEDENGDLLYPCPCIDDCKKRCLREMRFKV